MHLDTFEQISVDPQIFGLQHSLLTEGQQATINFANGEVVSGERLVLYSRCLQAFALRVPEFTPIILFRSNARTALVATAQDRSTPRNMNMLVFASQAHNLPTKLVSSQ